MGSTRLSGKVLMKLQGREVLGHVIDRVKASHVGQPIVLTTLAVNDIPIVRFCAEQDVLVFCGSENDVLDRFWQAAKLLDLDHIVRITADCPILDPEVLAHVVKMHVESGADYTSNVIMETFPDGLDCEIFTKASLEKAWNESQLASEREHVTPYIRKNPLLFKQHSVESKENFSQMRWTLDTDADFQFLTKLFEGLGTKALFGMEQVLVYLRAHPDVGAINGSIVRNEGYAKSIRDDLIHQGG